MDILYKLLLLQYLKYNKFFYNNGRKRPDFNERFRSGKGAGLWKFRQGETSQKKRRINAIRAQNCHPEPAEPERKRWSTQRGPTPRLHPHPHSHQVPRRFFQHRNALALRTNGIRRWRRSAGTNYHIQNQIVERENKHPGQGFE
jgi:hypothetical protein